MIAPESVVGGVNETVGVAVGGDASGDGLAEGGLPECVVFLVDVAIAVEVAGEREHAEDFGVHHRGEQVDVLERRGVGGEGEGQASGLVDPGVAAAGAAGDGVHTWTGEWAVVGLAELIEPDADAVAVVAGG